VSADVYRGALEAVDRIVNRESEADEVLRKTVEVLHDRFAHYSRVGIYLVEGDDLVLGPWKGPQATENAERIVVPIAYEGKIVGEIAIDSDQPAAFGEADRVFLERVALLISPHCLVAWDTGGVAWRDL
jgi:putative methionine-R-sulfoxide reductase with GAF domain